MKPVIQVLQVEHDRIQEALDQVQIQRDSLDDRVAALTSQRDDLKAAIDFMKGRGRP